ncbi:transposase, partial [Candidatus Kaiserbacteria bacterium]|nr:transposase [Candidatus Kaiserbacteria bacterium]
WYINCMLKDNSIAVDEYYHIYNRGTEKRVIYKTKSDYDRFMALLYLCNSTNPVSIKDEYKAGKKYDDLFLIDRNKVLVDIGAYVLMPNHFHILIKEVNEGGISQFMKKLSTGYSMYFNKKHDRTGVLFEGRYKAKRADTDEYLKYLFSYIHLNPIKLIEPEWKETGIKNRNEALKHLQEYKYSSYLDYQGVNRVVSNVLSKDSFPQYFLEENSFNDQITHWLDYSSANLSRGRTSG